MFQFVWFQTRAFAIGN